MLENVGGGEYLALAVVLRQLKKAKLQFIPKFQGGIYSIENSFSPGFPGLIPNLLSEISFCLVYVLLLGEALQ